MSIRLIAALLTLGLALLVPLVACNFSAPADTGDSRSESREEARDQQMVYQDGPGAASQAEYPPDREDDSGRERSDSSPANALPRPEETSPETDREALVALYNALGRPSYLETWDTPRSPWKNGHCSV